MKKASNKFLLGLLAIYAILFAVLAFNPVDRGTWFAENLTVWITIAVLAILYARGVRFSALAYVLMSIFVYLHTIGGHYTFEQVPFDRVTDMFGFERNHFDRIAHFSVGLYAFAVAEWIYVRGLVKNRFLLFTYPVFAVAAVAAGYEMVEWIYAASSDPVAGAAYLGSQGDIWEAQKDMLADTLGALATTTLYFFIRKPKKSLPL